MPKIKYKAILLLAAILIISTAQAQLTNDFELGNRNAYVADCWTFSGFSVNNSSVINGSFSAYSSNHNLPSGSSREVGSPFLEFSGNHTVQLSHRKIQSGNLLLEVVIADKDDNETVVFTRTGYPANTVQNEVFDINATGIYRVLFRTYPNGPGNSNNRSVFDDIQIAGVTDVADRNAVAFSPYNSTFVPCPCIQEAPVANDDDVELDEDTDIQISAFSNDTDEDGDLDPTSVTILNDASNGTTAVDPLTGIITYTPAANFFGTDQITYQISDQYPFGPVNTSSAVINILVNPVNDPPTSADNTVYTDEDVPYDFKADDILFNDVDGHCFNGFMIVTPLDPDLGELFYDGSEVVLNTLYADPDLLLFVPDPGISGITEFDFKVWDDQGGESESYTMTIVINDVNDLPLSEDIEVTMDPNTIYNFSSAQLAYSDADNDPFGGFTIVSLPADGTLFYDGIAVVANTLYADFSLVSFEPAADETGMPYTNFLFTVSDDRGGESAEYTATINVREQEPSELIISEGFSPNGDFVNDYWHIEGIDFYKGNVVEIYNRWGNPVRTIEGYTNESNAWRGESDNSAWGETVPVGSYFYIIRLGDDTPPIQGYVIINL